MRLPSREDGTRGGTRLKRDGRVRTVPEVVSRWGRAARGSKRGARVMSDPQAMSGWGGCGSKQKGEEWPESHVGKLARGRHVGHSKVGHGGKREAAEAPAKCPDRGSKSPGRGDIFSGRSEAGLASHFRNGDKAEAR